MIGQDEGSYLNNGTDGGERPSVVKLVTAPTAAEKQRLDTVSILREELARAEAGEICGVIVITKNMDTTWTHHTTGCSSVREEIGAIESLKWDRLYRLRDAVVS